MKIAITDDNNLEAKLLSGLLTEYCSLHRLENDISIFDSAPALLEDFKPLKYAIIFMDIYMLEMSGTEAAKKIREKDKEVVIIFSTSSSEHMPEAFSIHAYDYLIKPINKDRLFKLMDDLLKNHTSDEKCLQFYANKENQSIPYSSLAAIRTSGHYIDIIDIKGYVYRARLTFATVSEELLQDTRFLNIIRGVIVNMDCIIEFKDRMCSLEGGLLLPINVKNCKDIEQIWQNYLFKKKRDDDLERLGIKK